ncbi:hypothetical protein CkaCkLH20_03232 [Colletotrichum karsti]|uniref:Wax synthase domain-containing protein n=1 Tax=Colletotrichum karsti TaxID=1095194 RepID=A0A9P6LK47_9PEZI|nr:uncharacterized protein CkaCkLH20_03232 [Colletotrichum karsti]KAF9878999.1 hypothetical protein CkaCkLH20_03232 [Colletotrichum karsti]
MAAEIVTTLGVPNMTAPILVANFSKPAADLVNASTPLLAAVVRDSYRAIFKARVAAGVAKPFVLPYGIFGTFILPILYMSIPHRKRPWVYAARWVVLAFIVAFNIKIMRETSSTNMSMGYSSGLSAFWGILSNVTNLVFTAPQFDFERVARRKKTNTSSPKPSRKSSRSNSPVSRSSSQSGLRKRAGSKKRRNKVTAPEANVDEYEYYWQSYPDNGTFMERLGWVVDLYTNFRGVGWSWAVSSVPSPAPPEHPHTEELVKMDTIPLETFVGCQTYKNERDFMRRKIIPISMAYIILDIFKVKSTEDPYFIFGSAPFPLPPHLAGTPPWLLSLYRHSGIICTLYASIVMVFSVHDLFQYYVLSKFFPMRGELWQYSSVFGSFSQVFDRGLAGFWGAWWHQTFRHSFSAPGNWLVEHGYLKKGTRSTKLIIMAIAFWLSGLLHGAGSVTAIPETNWLKPCSFFWASGVGVLLQQGFCTTFKPQIAKLPRIVRRLGNLLFVFVWLQITVKPLADDFAETGLWLVEPVPVSVVRALGYGRGETSWWKPDMEAIGRWHKGEHWWESGFGY